MAAELPGVTQNSKRNNEQHEENVRTLAPAFHTITALSCCKRRKNLEPNSIVTLPIGVELSLSWSLDLYLKFSCIHSGK
jgi:hypothetical protein